MEDIFLRPETVAVGEIVYESFAPQNPGKVIEVIGEITGKELVGRYPDEFHSFPSDGFYVKIRWSKKGNPETIHSLMGIKRLAALIADHKKKYEGHIERFKRAESL
jgi:hypothetical protein